MNFNLARSEFKDCIFLSVLSVPKDMTLRYLSILSFFLSFFFFFFCSQESLYCYVKKFELASWKIMQK